MGTARSATHGEGDYEATRRYRKRTATFLAKNDVDKLARKAAPKSKTEAGELLAAEASGRARAKNKSKSGSRRSAPSR
jgi:histone H3/H4